MSFGAALVAIVALIVLGAVLRSRHHASIGHGTDQAGTPTGPSPRELEMEAELTKLRERVKVLERIATDENETSRLSSQIDKLRDE